MGLWLDTKENFFKLQCEQASLGLLDFCKLVIRLSTAFGAY